jgi:excisionase family DNA binding protein
MTERLAYRVPEAAEALGISPWSIWKLIREGDLQVVRSGKIVLVPRVAIEEFLRRGMEEHRQRLAEPELPEWLRPMVRGSRSRQSRKRS